MDKISLIKKRIREIRESKGLSRPKIFQETGISAGTIESWEIRKNKPNIEQLITLADYYNMFLLII